MGSRSPHAKAHFLGKRHARAGWARPTTLCCELCKNGWTDGDAVWVVDSGGLKEAQVQSYSTGGTANVPSCKNTLAPPGEYDWTVHVRRRCGIFVKLLWPLIIITLLVIRSKYAYCRNAGILLKNSKQPIPSCRKAAWVPVRYRNRSEQTECSLVWDRCVLDDFHAELCARKQNNYHNN